MSACRRLDVSVLLFRWCEFGARLFGNYLTPPPGTPLPQERGFTSHLVFFQSACRRGAALKSWQIPALRKPANSHLSFEGAKERCAKESSRSGAARLMLTRRMGLNSITHETSGAKCNTTVRRNLALRLLLNQGYSWQILHPVELPALALVARNAAFYIEIS